VLASGVAVPRLKHTKRSQLSPSRINTLSARHLTLFWAAGLNIRAWPPGHTEENRLSRQLRRTTPQLELGENALKSDDPAPFFERIAVRR
jgi:hypothetical protein